jgi:hypothetical protein
MVPGWSVRAFPRIWRLKFKSPALYLLGNLVRDLVYRTARFQNRRAVIHDPSQVGIRERETFMWIRADHIPRSRPSVPAEKESRLRAQVGVPQPFRMIPAILRLEFKSRAVEHGRELLWNLPLVGTERRREQVSGRTSRTEFLLVSTAGESGLMTTGSVPNVATLRIAAFYRQIANHVLGSPDPAGHDYNRRQRRCNFPPRVYTESRPRAQCPVHLRLRGHEGRIHAPRQDIRSETGAAAHCRG